MKSPNRNLLAMFFSSLVAMAACFQIGFHYGVRPYRDLLAGDSRAAVAQIAASQSKTIFAVSIIGAALAIAALAATILLRAKKEPILESSVERSRHRTLDEQARKE